MIVAAHQPAYLPWLGYFHKIASCDVFVLMDDLQYEQQNFQNRNRVKSATGPLWVTVPVVHKGQGERILDKRIANGQSAKEHWQRRTLLTLKNNYARAPHFARYAEELTDLYTRPWEMLVDLDIHVLGLCLRWLGISRPILRASSLDLEGQKTDRIADLCRKLGATTYLSGSGGSVGYLDVDALAQGGVKVEWQRFTHPSYPQRHPSQGFIPNLSAIDLLLNCGPESRAVLLGSEAEQGSAAATSA